MIIQGRGHVYGGRGQKFARANARLHLSTPLVHVLETPLFNNDGQSITLGCRNIAFLAFLGKFNHFLTNLVAIDSIFFRTDFEIPFPAREKFIDVAK